MWALEWCLLVSCRSNPISIFYFYVFQDSGFADCTVLYSIMCYCQQWIKMEPLQMKDCRNNKQLRQSLESSSFQEGKYFKNNRSVTMIIPASPGGPRNSDCDNHRSNETEYAKEARSCHFTPTVALRGRRRCGCATSRGSIGTRNIRRDRKVTRQRQVRALCRQWLMYQAMEAARRPTS